MGANGDLCVDGYQLAAFSYRVPALYCSLFQERERLVGEIQEPPEDHGGEIYTTKFVHYETTVKAALQRLSLMGFSLPRCKAQFEKGWATEVSELEAWAKTAPVEEDEDNYRYWQVKKWKTYLSQLRALNFEKWRETLRWFLEAGHFESTEYLEYRIGDEAVEQFSELFDQENEGFPVNMDLRMQWVAVLSTFEPNLPVVLDVSELVEYGRIQSDDRVIDIGCNELRHGISENEPILVLTEGSSDATILRLSLAALYPELEDRFQFLDFDSSNYGGGAPSLATQVKGFAAAGVRNKILGVVDNDAVGRDALRQLENTRLPPNIGVMTLPELAVANRYPTLGPLGKLSGTVNGLAVSIEFFAGEQLLMEAGGGEPDPVVWGSYISGLKTYQGELSRKTVVAKALRESLSRKMEPAAHKEVHPELCELWEQIFKLAETLQ